MEHWTDKIASLHPCGEALRWLRTQPDAATAWATCQRGDWMLWIAGKLSGEVGFASRLKLVGAAADCAATALPLYESNHPGDSRVRDCIDACRGHAAGTVTIDELRSDAAAFAADAAAYAAAAFAADADAAREASLAVSADIVRRHYQTHP